MTTEPIKYESKKGSFRSKVEAFLFPDIRERRNIFDKSVDGGRRTSDEVQTNLSKADWVMRSVILVGTLLAVCGLLFALNFYSSTLRSIDSDRDVVNLTKNGFETRINLVSEKSCDSADPACFLSPDFDDQSWEKAVIPKVDLTKIKGFSELESTGYAVYRAAVTIPSPLLKLDEKIALTPMYVNHPSYDVYMEGDLVYSGNGFKGNFPIVVIPQDKVGKQESVSLTIVGKMKEGWIGIQHHGGFYIGKKSTIDNLIVAKERTTFSYFLIFLCTKGAIFLIFSLFFIFSVNKAGLTYFLCFALFSTSSSLFEGGFLRRVIDLDYNILFYFVGNVVSYSALMAFYGEFYNSRAVKRLSAFYLLIGVPLVVAMWLDMAFGTQTIGINSFFNLTKIVTASTILIGVVTGYAKIGVFKRYQKTGDALNNAIVFTSVSSLFLILFVTNALFYEYRGFDFAAMLDMMFFFMVAYLTAREFATNEKRINTFKDIKKEKERMEQELNDAAVIANAFTPDSPPMWPSIDISSFHQPLTETSGDWFSFCFSPSGRFQHFLMCDVTGHGVQAALIVSSCKTVLSMMEGRDRDSLDTSTFLSDYARKLNEVLFSQGNGKHTTTFLGLTFDQEMRKIHYYSAAHPAPIIVRDEGEGGKKSKLLLSRNNPLGVEQSIDPIMKEADIKVSDHLLVYSDGIELYNNRRLLRYILKEDLSKSSEKAKEYVRLVKDFELKQKGYSIQDDTTLICFDVVA